MDMDRSAQALRELVAKGQELVEQGLVRMERSPSGSLNIQVIPVIQLIPQTGPPPPLPPPPPPPLPPPPPPLPSPCAPPPPAPPSLLAPGGGVPSPAGGAPSGGHLGPRKKRTIQTKYRMPLFNWQALKPHQVAGTIFHELDDEQVLEELNMDSFEEQFKTKAQTDPTALGTIKRKASLKTPSKVSLIDPNRAKNLAITLRKGGMAASDICTAIETYNQKALSLDFLELLERFIPSEYELKLIHNYESEGRAPEELSMEDHFMVRFGKIPRLSQRISILTFMGNFPDVIQLIQPQLDAIIAASLSIKSSIKLRKILEIILAFGNYMNSSMRESAYGFRLQSLDLLLDTKSTDRKRTLLHFIVGVIQEKYPQIQSFYTELHFMDKAALVSLDSILQDVHALERGMEVTQKQDNPVLQRFLTNNNALLESVAADGKTAQDAYDSAVEYFGENPKTTPPSVFFPVFVRFIKAYKQAEQENEQRKKHFVNREAPSMSPKPEVTIENKNSQASTMPRLPEVDLRKKFDAPPTPPKPKVTNKNSQASTMPRLPGFDLKAELERRKRMSLVWEGKDGAIEDIITDLRNQTLRKVNGVELKEGQQLHVSSVSDISL